MSAQSIFDTNPEDFRIDMVYDQPTSGMRPCIQGRAWIIATHLPTMAQARIYADRGTHAATASALDALEYMLADWRGEKCGFPENLPGHDSKEAALSEMARLGQEWDAPP